MWVKSLYLQAFLFVDLLYAHIIFFTIIFLIVQYPLIFIFVCHIFIPIYLQILYNQTVYLTQEKEYFMERILHYDLTSDNEGYKISQYLRHLGYTGQNLTELKKMPESILPFNFYC